MAAPARSVHQDYVARIRYSNTLPPPPVPPKLLDIPNTGLSGGQYTAPGFASRLAREQQLNIEPDAELGMPIDLVGLPGVFDGDESSIYLPSYPPPLHPSDKALLRPLNSLGKASTASGANFLRRTEYGVGGGANRIDSSVARRPNIKRKPQDTNKNNPIFILRSILKGFDIAYPQDAYTGEDTKENLRSADISTDEKQAWNNPRHPTKPDMKLLDSYPIYPDLDGVPDTSTNSYQILKFSNPPTDSAHRYDESLDVALLRPCNQDQVRITFEAEQAANPKSTVIPKYDYEYFLPNDGSVRGIKRKLNVADPENESEDLYDADSLGTDKPRFLYRKKRMYETTVVNGNPADTFTDTMAIALHDGEAENGEHRSMPKGAYFYPVNQRSNIRPKRPINAASQFGMTQEEEEGVDIMDVTVRGPDEEDVARRDQTKAIYDPEPAAS